jgi:SpoVK/Ycf46/Vps4 family AAA+-type ATPase
MQNWVLGTDCAIKSLCLVGPAKCGKKFLVEAICSEMDAIIFDISPKNVKDIENMPKFLSLVMQMAIKFQPSVILVDGAHKPFIRKITEKVKAENPKKLGKFLVKYIVRQLTAEDAVVLIGTTNEPWNCNPASLKSCYEKFLSFPTKLDYQTAMTAWRKGLEKKRIYNFDASSLGEVTRNFTTGDILDAIDSYVNLKRRVM